MAHSGAKYHPDHFLCEFPRCATRLDEYYEADGKLFCERHANVADQAALYDDGGRDDNEGGNVPVPDTPKTTSRALKRSTRFIDIVGVGLR